MITLWYFLVRLLLAELEFVRCIMAISRCCVDKLTIIGKCMEETVMKIESYTFNNFGIQTVIEIKDEKVICLGCDQWFKRVLGHLKISKKCQDKVDMDQFSNAIKEIKKEKERNRKKAYRESRTTNEKEVENKRQVESMKKLRQSRTTEEKKIIRKGEAERKKKVRESKTAEEKITDRKKQAETRKKLRESKTAKEKTTARKVHVETMKLSRKRKYENNHEQQLSDQNNQRKKHRMMMKENVGSIERLIKFRQAVKFGAIFICSSCHQRLYENGVSLLTSKFKEDVVSKAPGLYEECIEEITQYMKKKPQSYICHTCKETLSKGKMPCMSVKNGLFLSPLADQELKMSEIENNLIAQNILFQKIF